MTDGVWDAIFIILATRVRETLPGPRLVGLNAGGFLIPTDFLRVVLFMVVAFNAVAFTLCLSPRFDLTSIRLAIGHADHLRLK
jgi:hypothetical protein